MSIEIKIPVLPESVADATIAKWHKKVGDAVKRDENLVDLETDKVILEVPSPVDGILEKIIIAEGGLGNTDDVIALISEGAVLPKTAEKNTASAPTPAAPAASTTPTPPAARTTPVAPTSSAALTTSLAAAGVDELGLPIGPLTHTTVGDDLSPSMRRKINSGEIPAVKHSPSAEMPLTKHISTREEQRVPMTRLRQRIAERLLEATQTTAMLTTFNEVDLKQINKLRERYKDAFEKKYGTRLGYMSFFTYAAVEALKRFPDVNASIDATTLVYHNYFDIGIAVSSERGLVVPIIRDADQLSFAEIEQAIKAYAEKARNNQLTLEEITGGTFTITNGGGFGSLLSTPILNPPQSAILGMHNIIERPIVDNGQIVARPMMYLALSYDHRVVDGKQSVLFLKTIKELLENPGQTLLAL